ncbi:hypothetical protein, partial [Halomonas sp. BC04]|uniref:hypothetical protein n=1 Tax=Halomonas sp. BC04 TaxID=1403540 RepID=UPI0005B89F9B
MAYCAAMLSFLSLAWEDAHSLSPHQKSAIPIVINIRLEEDCLVVADEDFVLLDQYDQHGMTLRSPKYISALLKATREEGLNTWNKYGSAGIVRPGGLPCTWIQSFEHPKLKLEKSPEIISDVELMLLSYRQQQEGLSFLEIAKQRWKFQTLGETFSQCHSFSNEGIESYQKQKILNNIAQLNEYVRELRGAIVNVGTYKHGLPFNG